jgi:hypothetical protein
MDPTTLYMLALCAHWLCLPLDANGFTMDEAECQARVKEMLVPAGCFNERALIGLLRREMREPAIGPIAR